MIAPYTAVAVQIIIRHVKEPKWRDAIIRENVNRSLSMMDYVSHRFGAAKLFVLPEFCLTGAELGGEPHRFRRARLHQQPRVRLLHRAWPDRDRAEPVVLALPAERLGLGPGLDD